MSTKRHMFAQFASLILLLALGLAPAGCSYTSPVDQASGLPTLHQLHWGFAYADEATWSPNGRWIALLAGDHVATAHLEVVSPDGHFKQDLSGWGCGLPYNFSFAWRPDNALTCLNDTSLISGTYPFSSQIVTNLQSRLMIQDKSLSWSPDGSSLITASVTTPGDINAGPGSLYVVSAQGRVDPTPLTPLTEDVAYPAWRPHAQQISYVVASGPNGSHLQLLLSSITRGPGGHLALGSPALLADMIDSSYVWSPTGTWVAVRNFDVRAPDRIYLVNPAAPSHTVTVVQTDQGMDEPIWSPDGQTMIVFSVGYDTSTPYELDIGAYLKSKGLQP